jgi:hypothetical protein
LNLIHLTLTRHTAFIRSANMPAKLKQQPKSKSKKQQGKVEVQLESPKNETVGGFINNSSFVRSLRGKSMCTPPFRTRQSLTPLPDQNQSDESDNTPSSDSVFQFQPLSLPSRPSPSHMRLAENDHPVQEERRRRLAMDRIYCHGREDDPNVPMGQHGGFLTRRYRRTIPISYALASDGSPRRKGTGSRSSTFIRRWRVGFMIFWLTLSSLLMRVTGVIKTCDEVDMLCSFIAVVFTPTYA